MSPLISPSRRKTTPSVRGVTERWGSQESNLESLVGSFGLLPVPGGREARLGAGGLYVSVVQTDAFTVWLLPHGAVGGSRTPTPLRARASETRVSTKVPPRPRGCPASKPPGRLGGRRGNRTLGPLWDRSFSKRVRLTSLRRPSRWCGWGESNPHVLADTSLSNSRVYLSFTTAAWRRGGELNPWTLVGSLAFQASTAHQPPSPLQSGVGGTRTPTALQPPAPQAGVSTIPPRPQGAERTPPIGCRTPARRSSSCSVVNERLPREVGLESP